MGRRIDGLANMGLWTYPACLPRMIIRSLDAVSSGGASSCKTCSVRCILNGQLCAALSLDDPDTISQLKSLHWPTV